MRCESTRRHPSLDGLRGVAILWVLGYHLFDRAPLHPGIEAVPGLGGLLSFGWLGVVVFFVLSGYLITSQLIAAHGRDDYWPRFLAKRVARILPVYALLLLTLPLGAALWPAERAGPVFNDLVPFWSHGLFVQNLFMVQSGYLGNEWLRATWSLAVEVQYYLGVALFVAWCPSRWRGTGLLLLALAAVASRYAMAAYLPHPGAAMMAGTVARLDSFALGGLVALLPAGPWSRRSRWACGAVAGLGTLLFLVYARGGFGALTPLVQPAYYAFASLAAAALIALLVREPRADGWLGGAALTAAGRYSYFLYLFHLPVVWTCHELLHRAPPQAGTTAGCLTSLLGLAVTWILAVVSWRMLEAPAIAAARRWLGRQQSAAADQALLMQVRLLPRREKPVVPGPMASPPAGDARTSRPRDLPACS